MKKIILLVLAISLFVSCSGKKDIPELLRGSFQSHSVSFDDTKPTIDLENNKLKEILVLLHHRVSEEKIKTHFSMTDSIWNDRINYLFGQGLIKKNEEGRYLPTFFILDRDNAATLKKFTDSLGVEMSEIALDRLVKIKTACSKIASLKNIPFDNISLFILGCVAQDYWQEKYFQDQFIKSFVPHRGSSDYYFALIQNEKNDKAPVKIFDTKFYDFSSFLFGTYCYSDAEQNLATISDSILKDVFDKSATENDSVFRIKLINDLIGLNKNPAFKMEANRLEGLKNFGLVVNGKVSVPYFTKADEKKLYGVSSIVTTDIVNYFENRQTLFVKHYLNSQYREETNYKEWMVWIYKMITASAVEELIRKSVIKIPADHCASFIIQK